MPVPPLAGRIKVLGIPTPAGDGRLWFQTGKVTCGDGECDPPTQGVLWSFAPGDERPRRELSAVDFAVRGDLLAWTEEPLGDTVHLRDLATATSATTPSTATAASTPGRLGRPRGRCVRVELRPPGRDRRRRTARRRPTAGYEYASVGEQWVLISPYAYDTETGKLLRLFRPGRGADQTRDLVDDLAVVPLGEANAVGTFAHWGVVRLRSAR